MLAMARIWAQAEPRSFGFADRPLFLLRGGDRALLDTSDLPGPGQVEAGVPDGFVITGLVASG